MIHGNAVDRFRRAAPQSASRGLETKIGTTFTEADQSIAPAPGVQAAVVENVHLLNELRARVAALEQELQRTAALVREEERAQLSRTLHDEVGQALVGLKIDAHSLAVALRPVIGEARPDLINHVDSMLQRLDETIESVRTTASDLRPPVLDKLGLVAAIAWQAEEFERRSGIRCRVSSRPRTDDSEFDSGRATGVFRIVQEALTNVLQHARASRATVTIRPAMTSLIVSIADNGCGIADRDLVNGHSLGLIGMRERSELLGGRLEVRRRRPTGTLVKLTVPRIATRAASG